MTLRSPLPGIRRFLAAQRATTEPGGLPPSWFERILVPAMIIVYAVVTPFIGLGRMLSEPHRPVAAVAAAIATACSLPLQVWLLAPTARARRPRHALGLVTVFTVVNLIAFVFAGPVWFIGAEELGVFAAVLLPLIWSVPAVVALAAMPAALAVAGLDSGWGRFYALAVVFQAWIVGMLTWLVRTATELRAGRRELADSAVISERVRIDDELRVTLGAELEKLIAAGERAARIAREDPARGERELLALTDASRLALAQTRQLVSGYRAATVRSELGTAVALLAAAGIPSRVEIPPAALGQTLDTRRLAGFRSDLTTVLRAEDGSGCVITVDGDDGDVRLRIRGRQREPS